MQKYYNTIVNAQTGVPVAGAQVTVKTNPGGTVATIYSDNGVTPTSNPVSTDGNGLFFFYAADGHYDLVVSYSGATQVTVTDQILFDNTATTGAGSVITINSDSVQDELTAFKGSGGAAAIGTNDGWSNAQASLNARCPVVTNKAAAQELTVEQAPDGVFVASFDGGPFYRDPSDTTSAENGGSYCGTVIRGSDYATQGVFKLSLSMVSVRNFGAKGDYKQITDGAMTSGSNIVSSASSLFAAIDVGKTIVIPGAGVAGAKLTTTVSGYTDSNHITVAVNASTTVSSQRVQWATDDTTAFTSAIATNKRIYVPEGGFLVTSPLTKNNNFNNSSDPYSPNQYDSGLVLIGAGMNKTQIYAGFSAPALRGATAQGVINMPAAVTLHTRVGTRLEGFSIFPFGGISNTHGILMNANWFANFSQVRVQTMPGDGFYSPLRTDLSSNPDDYQNSVLQVTSCWFNANGNYGFYGESGLGMASTRLQGSFFYNNQRSGIRIGGVNGVIENCAIAGNGIAGSFATVDNCGLVIDNLSSTTPRNFTLRNNEYESNFGANLWLRSCIGFKSTNGRLNSQISPDGGVTLNAPVQVLLADAGGSIRSARFECDVSKSPPTGTGSTAALSMYKLYSGDVAQLEIYEPYGTAGGDNTSAFIVMDTSVSTGALDGVHYTRNGLKQQTRAWSNENLAKAYFNANQSVANSTNQVLIPETEIVDNASALNSSTGVFTVPSVGLYKVRAKVQTQAPVAAKTVILRIRRTGASLSEAKFITTGAAFETYVIEDIINCATAGDTLSVEMNQNTGGSLTLDGGLTANSFIFERIG